jgi:polysaccharide biosynthesis transport protein
MTSGPPKIAGDPRPTASGLVVPSSPLLPVRNDPYAQIGSYGGAPDNDGERGFNLSDYWRIVNKRRWLILSVIGLALVLGGLRTLMMTPMYTATVRLQIDRNVNKVVESGNIAPTESNDFEFLKTQFELLQSRSISERVVSSLRLASDADFLKPQDFSIIQTLLGLVRDRSSEPVTQASQERKAALVVFENRAVRPVPGSRLVDVTYTDPAPDRARRVAMAIADAYIASNIDKRFEANSYAKTFLEDQSKQLKIRLEESEKALLDFAQREQIVVVTEKSSNAENNLASANAALGVLISERIKNEQLWRQVEQSSAINLPQLLTNTVIDGLRGRRNALNSEYQEKLETFKPEYPAMLQIKNKINEIDRQLTAEVLTIKASYKAAFEAAGQQETEMKARIDALKAEVLDLQQRGIQYNILKREVDTNRTLYESLLQRFKQVDIASGVGANNIFIVDKAEAPRTPSSPHLLRALLVALGLGLAAGLALAFILEKLDDTVSSTEDLERIGGLATLGIIPKVPDGRTIEAEIDDPRSMTSEAYRSLCTALQFSTDSGLPRALFVTSATPSEGKSSTAIAIARHFSNLGLRVLLVDADLRKPSLHHKLQTENGTGLSNYLTGACTPQEAMKATSNPNLSIITSGPLPPNSGELLAGARMASLLAFGSETFNLLVIDGPPVMGLADAPLLAGSGLATIFIVGAGQARTRSIRDALRRVQFSRGVVLGAVLTKFDSKAAGYGYGYGDSGYTYGDQPAAPAVALASQTPQNLHGNRKAG